MKIISKIEINYFRSIYSINLNQNNNINILIGGNDCGKSNILKSLNLFFNNQTELQNSFNFTDDLSRLREEQARATKGRAFLWIRITFNNFLNWSSLPDQFAVKKTWNRYDDQPIPTYPSEIAQNAIGRFLNKISFHYIPAVRGRDIFSHYLNALHDALVEDEKAGVNDATAGLMQSINESTEDMSKRIKSELGFTSNIQVPKDLRDLFSALDFSTKFSGYDIPLQKRGDGIQARHIPFILDFIARHSNKHHIWAYEEPENSLELGRSFELAEQFSNDFSTENQIYMTTHSPAFYDLNGDHINKWFVKSQPYKDDSDFVTELMPISQNELADESLGVAALIAARAKDLHKKINLLEETTKKLDEKIKNINLPLVIVEGPSDKTIFDHAYSKLFPDKELSFEFSTANGCSNISAFIQSASKLNKNNENPIIGIFDHDSAGINEIRKFNSYKKIDDTEFRVINTVKDIYCGILPLPNELLHPKKQVEQAGDLATSFPIPIEFMFPQVVINEALEEGVLELEERITTAKDSELSAKINLTDIYKNKLPDDYHYLAYKINNDSKIRFSEWTAELDREHFAHFTPLFDILFGLINTKDE